MAPYHLPLSGFELGASAGPSASNSLAAYRIHAPDPILFRDSLALQWQVTDNGAGIDCPHTFPDTPRERPAGTTPSGGTVSIEAHTFFYVY
jgi:hypothetical protein